MGTTTKVISIKSKIKPSKKVTSITSNMAVSTPPGSCSKKPCTSSSPPKPRNTKEKMEAPIKIINTIAVTFTVFSNACHNNGNLKRPITSAISTDPTAPIAAASVGVVKPVKIAPNTAKINNKGGNSPRKISAIEADSDTCCGVAGGRRQVYHST